MVLAGPYGCVGRSWTTYLKKYFLAWYLKLFIRTHCAGLVFVFITSLHDQLLQTKLTVPGDDNKLEPEMD